MRDTGLTSPLVATSTETINIQYKIDSEKKFLLYGETIREIDTRLKHGDPLPITMHVDKLVTSRAIISLERLSIRIRFAKRSESSSRH